LQEKEVNEVKRVFLEGNPYLLALTFFVSLLHSVFDALAFKNDIGFWKANKSMVRNHLVPTRLA
jgi:Cleft lip and palate transmembrane protein 1 (CLPTM1)